MANLNLYNATKETAIIRDLEAKIFWAAKSLAIKDYSLMNELTLEANLKHWKSEMDLATEEMLRKTAPIRYASELNNFLKPNQSRLERTISNEIKPLLND